jgi:hypothetical protein
MRLYVSGPMRGYPEDNFPAFHEATATLREEGHDVTCPAETSQRLADETARGLDEITFAEYMRTYDYPAVVTADAVVVLPGWKASIGARLEVMCAHVCGIPVIKYESRNVVPPPAVRHLRLALDVWASHV